MGLVEIVENVRKRHVHDGILSWILCVCALISNAIVIGIDSSFGKALGSIIKDFNETESNVAWIGSVHSSTQYFSASLSSLLAMKYGFGYVIIAGILISSTFFALSTTSQNIFQITMQYGILGGMGVGLIYTAGTIICTFHFFEKTVIGYRDIFFWGWYRNCFTFTWSK